MRCERPHACRTFEHFLNRACSFPQYVATTGWEPVRDHLRFRCLRLEIKPGLMMVFVTRRIAQTLDDTAKIDNHAVAQHTVSNSFIARTLTDQNRAPCRSTANF